LNRLQQDHSESRNEFLNRFEEQQVSIEKINALGDDIQAEFKVVKKEYEE